MRAITERCDMLSCVDACAALGVARASYYRSQGNISHETPVSQSKIRPRKRSPRALTAPERARVLEVLHDERFRDQAVPQVYATLIDEGEYLCSMRTMYRILAKEGEVRERRNQLRHPTYSKPELLATGPNQVWSWDITKLRGPRKWTYFYLYVVLDIFSRYAVGWMVASRESAALGKKLIAEAARKQSVDPGQVTLHSDRGSPMTAKTMALLLADLGITKSHSRPHVSDDNPFSEAQFKTVKYRPDFPGRFGCLEDARLHMGAFFDWYHREHHHSGLAWMTPAEVHHGRAPSLQARRAQVLKAAYERHPERFVRYVPTPPALPEAVWINEPVPQTAVAQ